MLQAFSFFENMRYIGVMNTLKAIITCLSVLLLLSACGRTTSSNATSFVDLSFSSAQAPSHIFVSAERAGLEEQDAIEQGLVTALIETELKATKGSLIYLPTRTYSDKEKRKLAIETGAQAVLLITPEDKDVHEVYTQPDEFGYAHDPFYRDHRYSPTYGYGPYDPYYYGPRTRVGAYGGSRSGVRHGAPRQVWSRRLSVCGSCRRRGDGSRLVRRCQLTGAGGGARGDVRRESRGCRRTEGAQ